MSIHIANSIADVDRQQWNQLLGVAESPFLRHEFLYALERYECATPKWGWHPRHLLLRGEGGELLGAVPLYLKDNSYGEFVFDWSWADAYSRAGLNYYPKLLSGIPYTPATGVRLLVSATTDSNPDIIRKTLVSALLDYAREQGVSSLHINFTNEVDTHTLQSQGLLRRTGTQFHWFNQGYRNFDDFLFTLTASKRKKVKRERRRVAEQGIEIEILDGHQASEAHWHTFTRFYLATFDKHWGYATLNEPFFRHLGKTIPENIVLVMARHSGEYVAAALSFRSNDTLYGRHWGCTEEFHSLHFELCYYQGIEYAIAHGLKRFEPGAQGEHKVGRGFLPTPTWSAHWLADPMFARTIEGYLAHEHEAMLSYMEELKSHLPYKHDDS